MKVNWLQSLKEDRLKVIAWFIGFFIVFLLDIPITFLTAFTNILSGYIIGDMLEVFISKQTQE